jgi:hypothetical protein
MSTSQELRDLSFTAMMGKPGDPQGAVTAFLDGGPMTEPDTWGLNADDAACLQAMYALREPGAVGEKALETLSELADRYHRLAALVCASVSCGLLKGEMMYEYNVYEGPYPGVIAVTRRRIDDDPIWGRMVNYDDYNAVPTAYIYAPDTADPEADTEEGMIDYVEGYYFDFDDPDLPWYVELLEFES